MKLQAIIDKFVEKPLYLRKGAGYLANLFETSRETIYKAKEKANAIIHHSETAALHNHIGEVEDLINRRYNAQKGECDLDGVVPARIKTLDDLVRVCQIDTQVWDVVSWECTKWEVGRKHKSANLSFDKGTASGTVNDRGTILVEPLFRVSAKLQKIKPADSFRVEFQKFLSTYRPAPVDVEVSTIPYDRERALLILPKQDAHFNRSDAQGRNSIQERFSVVLDATLSIVREAAALHELDKITYIVGSDQFNSEWTGLTTAGTPQQNILSYQAAFRAICDHEVTVIEHLRRLAGGVEVLFVPGNHDEYAGWHLVNWLACYYRDAGNVLVTEGSPDEPRLYERYGTTAIMYDHGALLDGKALAQRFPIEFRSDWSQCENYYIFSGDKHHEMSLDVHGIKYYRVPALSNTRSKWEHKKGYISRGEMQAFLIKEGRGLTNMYGRLLE